VNDEIDLAARRLRLVPAANLPHEIARGLSIASSAPSLPKLGDLSGPPGPALPPMVQVIHEAYQVRSLLSRGAVIDLVG
jgi:hypothetical protein